MEVGDWPLSHHPPHIKNLGMWIIAANSAYPQHKCMTCKKGYVPIVFVLQVSISVLNALGINLPVPKTIFQTLAEFSSLKGYKNGVPMTSCIFCASGICAETL